MNRRKAKPARKDSIIHHETFAFADRYPGTEVLEPLRDKVGVYAYLIRRTSTGRVYYFAAKRQGKGGLVSIHHELMTAALGTGRQIVLHFGSHDYLINPRAIRTNHEYTNTHNDALMVNFMINKVGAQNIEKLLSPRETGAKKPPEPDPDLFTGALEPRMDHDRIARMIDPDAELIAQDVD